MSYWVLLPAAGMDWRWHKDRSDSPWYPDMRLFHQAPGEQWRDVVLRVRDALFRFLAHGRVSDTAPLPHE